jgi:hypothetical protein
LGVFGKAKNDRQCATSSRIGALSTFYRPLTPARAVRIGPKKEGIAPLHHWREKGFSNWDGTDGHGGSICAMFGPLIYSRSRTTSNQIYILVPYLQDGVPRETSSIFHERVLENGPNQPTTKTPSDGAPEQGGTDWPYRENRHTACEKEHTRPIPATKHHSGPRDGDVHWRVAINTLYIFFFVLNALFIFIFQIFFH